MRLLHSLLVSRLILINLSLIVGTHDIAATECFAFCYSKSRSDSDGLLLSSRQVQARYRITPRGFLIAKQA